MAVEFQASKTRENLMRAFAGESQARNRYTIAADPFSPRCTQATKSSSRTFPVCSSSARESQNVFLYKLSSPFVSDTATTIQIDGSYPVDHFDCVKKLLRAAEHNELQEFDDVYPAFGNIAREEGFAEEAAIIAHIQLQRFFPFFLCGIQCQI